MSRKKRKSIWKSTFYRVYFALVALALVAIAVGTVWLRGVLKDYESAQPKYVAEGVGKLFENADYEAIYNVDTSAAQFEGDEALYLDNLRELAAGRRVEWTPAFSANKDERKYNVNLDGEALSADNATTTEKALFEADFLPPGVKNPVLVEYRYDAASETPQVAVSDETGAPMAVAAVEGKELTWSCPMKSDEAYSAQYGSAAIALAKQVAKFMNKDARKKAIERVCAKNSPAESIFDNLSNAYATPHSGISFKDEAVSEFYVMADDCFTCRVSFDTVLRTEKGDAVYPTAYTFCVIKEGDAGKLWNIKVY